MRSIPFMLVVVALLSTGLFPYHCAAQKVVYPERVDAALAKLVSERGLVGVSALVFEKGEEVYFGAHGYAEREVERPMARDTMAYIYSMTKPITGVALMTLYDQGAFKLDDPLEKYAPEFADLKVYAGDDATGHPIYETPKRPATIRDVTRHTAGFSRGSAGNHIARVYQSENPMSFDNSLTEMAEKLGRIPLGYHPGERWLYGDSVDVQAFLVERISGQPFEEYLKEKIFQPLGMQHTGYHFGPQFDDRRTRIYMMQPDGSFALEEMAAIAYNQEPRALKPGGYGLIST